MAIFAFQDSARKSISFQELSQKNTFYLPAKNKEGSFCFGTRARNAENQKG